MSRRPRVTGADLVAALGNVGFAILRTKGSHHFLGHEDGRTNRSAVHSGETIGPLSRFFAIVKLLCGTRSNTYEMALGKIAAYLTQESARDNDMAY